MEVEFLNNFFMPKIVVFYLIEGLLLLPFPLYCICEELLGTVGWLRGIGYLLAVPLLALYIGSFHGLAVRLYPNGLSYYLVSFLLTTCICWWGLFFVEGSGIFYKDTWPIALGVSGFIGLLGLIPAYMLR